MEEVVDFCDIKIKILPGRKCIFKITTKKHILETNMISKTEIECEFDENELATFAVERRTDFIKSICSPQFKISYIKNDDLIEIDTNDRKIIIKESCNFFILLKIRIKKHYEETLRTYGYTIYRGDAILP